LPFFPLRGSFLFFFFPFFPLSSIYANSSEISCQTKKTIHAASSPELAPAILFSPVDFSPPSPITDVDPSMLMKENHAGPNSPPFPFLSHPRALLQESRRRSRRYRTSNSRCARSLLFPPNDLFLFFSFLTPLPYNI